MTKWLKPIQIFKFTSWKGAREPLESVTPAKARVQTLSLRKQGAIQKNWIPVSTGMTTLTRKIYVEFYFLRYALCALRYAVMFGFRTSLSYIAGPAH